MKQDENE